MIFKKNIIVVFFVLTLLNITVLHAGLLIDESGFTAEEKKFISLAYDTIGGKTAVAKTRKFNMEYDYTDFLCCCSRGILRVFELGNIDMVTALNKATDEAILVLAKKLEEIKAKKNEIKSLEVTNALYSYTFDANVSSISQSGKGISGSGVPPDGLCSKIITSSVEDLDWYQKNVTDVFESNGNYSASNCSGAYGRYQMMPSYANDDKAGSNAWCHQGGVNCCNDLGTTYQKMCNNVLKSFKIYQWHGSKSCQDNMFTFLTKGNLAQINNNNFSPNACNLYLVHQQGLGGLRWLHNRGKNPYNTFGKLQNAIKQNLGSEWAKAVLDGKTTTEQGLREVYQAYWIKKFKSNPFLIGAGATQEQGSNSTVDSNLTADSNVTVKGNTNPFLREGILYEMYKQIGNYKNTKMILDTRIDFIEEGVKQMIRDFGKEKENKK